MSLVVRMRHRSPKELRELVLSALMALVAIALGVMIAASYFGHSPSPYGTCYGSTGRSVPCEAIRH